MLLGLPNRELELTRMEGRQAVKRYGWRARRMATASAEGARRPIGAIMRGEFPVRLAAATIGPYYGGDNPGAAGANRKIDPREIPAPAGEWV